MISRRSVRAGFSSIDFTEYFEHETWDMLNGAAEYSPCCSCLVTPASRLLSNENADLIYTKTPCSLLHSTVSFRWHPLYRGVTGPEIIPHSNHVKHFQVEDNRMADGLNFFCCPSFGTQDNITLNRNNNAIFRELPCPDFSFNFGALSTSSFSYDTAPSAEFPFNIPAGSGWRNVLSHIATFIDWDQWWVEKVHTCEDIRFVHFMIGPALLCPHPNHPNLDIVPIKKFQCIQII